MTCIETIILIYLISTVGMYFITKKQFSKGGRWENLKPSIIELIYTFLPFLNTVCLVLSIIMYSNFDLCKFYNVKK
jgi:hypothetical protein